MSSDVKTIFDPAEMESVGEKLGYGKDSKERLPWEHYLSQYQEADPKEIAERLGISYNEEEKSFTLKFLGTTYQISWPDFQVSHEADDMGFYPLETMVYARTLTIRFLLNRQSSGINHGLCQNSDDSLSAEWCRIYRHRQIQNLSRNAVGRSLSETV